MGSDPIPLAQPDIDDADVRAVEAVLRSGRLSLGPELPAFESEAADYIGTRHAVGTSSGTASLHLALRALDIGEGDEVITTSFSFIASANAILYVGAKPVFVDIDPVTLNLDPAGVEAAITPRTKALLVVHVFGRPAAMDAIMDIAERHELRVVEDACEAIGAAVGGRKLGGIGDVGVFGFYPNKLMTMGEGGLITTNDDAVARRATRWRNQGRAPGGGWFDHVDLGYNYRLTDIQAALGRSQLRRIESFVERRATVARLYDERLRDHPSFEVPAFDAPGERMAWFVYVIRVRDPLDRAARDRIQRSLADEGIGCGRYFAPIHLQPLYRERFPELEGALPITESAGDRALALPFFNALDEARIDRVCAALARAADSLQ